jgi:hypothetical protein
MEHVFKMLGRMERFACPPDGNRAIAFLTIECALPIEVKNCLLRALYLRFGYDPTEHNVISDFIRRNIYFELHYCKRGDHWLVEFFAPTEGGCTGLLFLVGDDIELVMSNTDWNLCVSKEIPASLAKKIKRTYWKTHPEYPDRGKYFWSEIPPPVSR